MSGTKTIEATIAQSDPMALHQSDHPGLILVSKPLDGNNYGQWSRAMRIALIAKNKIRQVEVATDREGQHSINWEKSNWKSDNRPSRSTDSSYRSTVSSETRQKQCVHCGMTGHIVDTCYFIHGFSPGHKFHGKDVKSRNKRFTNAAIAPTPDPNKGKTLTAKEYE
ncbi:Retrotran gag 3 domain-containing protein [Abeliophyllum distichum]|uniref:Retrotran gag 3 domain-containing protein n=1 Tax=Abeliophyllum distichum TaxID=126358 RepID=A0ABD1TYS2_9LAMI